MSSLDKKKTLFYYLQILMESEQLRRENDSSGPQDELEYWKKRAAQFSQLLINLQVILFSKSTAKLLI